MPKTKMELKDDEIVRFEVSKKDDGKLWILMVSADTPLSQDEFAASCLALGNDVLDGNVSWEDAEEIEGH